jgi:hypothetical protein
VDQHAQRVAFSFCFADAYAAVAFVGLLRAWSSLSAEQLFPFHQRSRWQNDEILCLLHSNFLIQNVVVYVACSLLGFRRLRDNPARVR